MTDSSSYDEKLLLNAVAVGDRQAFTRLYSIHIDNLYHYIYLFTKSKEETEELLQDLFVTIWEKRESLSEVESFKAYIYRAAKNKLVSHVRHLQVKHKVLTEMKRQKDNSEHRTENDITYKEYYELVQKAIDMLPPKRKLIFRLSTENGLSYDEIAERLNLSKSTVKNQLYTAFEFVREHLSRHGVSSFGLIIILLGHSN